MAVIGAAVAFNSISHKPVIEIPELDDGQLVIAVVNPPQPKQPEQAILPPAKKREEHEVTKKELQNATIVKNTESPDDVKTNAAPPTGSTTNGVEGGTSTASTPPTSGTTNSATPADNGNGTVTTAMLDKLPEYPGGIHAFLRYVGDNFRKPVLDEAKTVRVIVSFVIEKDGRMTDIQVLQNPGYGLDKEAIRVLKSQKTKWAPGMKNGQPVRTLYMLPIKIKVD
jgi:protein TonB